jgi:hypothetical protein
MKKIVKKPKEGVYQLWCDATGDPIDQLGQETPPPIEVKISFGYGSVHDGEEITLHYTDKSFEPILKSIKTNLCQKTKEELKKTSEIF